MVASLYFGGKSHVSNGQNVSLQEPCRFSPRLPHLMPPLVLRADHVADEEDVYESDSVLARDLLPFLQGKQTLHGRLCFPRSQNANPSGCLLKCFEWVGRNAPEPIIEPLR